ncbi:MAG: MBL fold metallo-hydrolase [Candidatus Binatia bacterium]
MLLVDPGPSTCLAALTRGLERLGLAWPDVQGLLLTHIHLDHAGVSGTLAQRWPGLPVYVHELGARHLAQPEKLLASATRLYGADMDRLWGEFLAVPPDALRALKGGESLVLGGRAVTVAHTPGHAVHHVAYFDQRTRTAFVGDTGGVRVGFPYAFAPTPPPDIDVAWWLHSVDAIAAWVPETLFLTHFGAYDDAPAHLARFRDALVRASAAARDVLKAAGGADEAALTARWIDWMRAELRTHGATDAQVQAAEAAAPFDQVWQGIARYWRKRVEREGPGALDASPV